MMYPIVPTGCGKSTVIQLIQRFYDLDSGSLTLEGKDIRSLNLPLVRSNLGIVSQGCNSIDSFFVPKSGPSHVMSLETCLNLKCPSTEFVPEHGPVLCPKF